MPAEFDPEKFATSLKNSGKGELLTWLKNTQRFVSHEDPKIRDVARAKVAAIERELSLQSPQSTSSPKGPWVLTGKGRDRVYRLYLDGRPAAVILTVDTHKAGTVNVYRAEVFGEFYKMFENIEPAKADVFERVKIVDAQRRDSASQKERYAQD